MRELSKPAPIIYNNLTLALSDLSCFVVGTAHLYAKFKHSNKSDVG